MPDDLIFDSAAYWADANQEDLDRGYYANSVTFNSPPAAVAVGGWDSVFKPAATFITGLATTAGQVMNTRNAMIAAEEQSAFDRMFKTSQLDLAKYQVTTGGAIEKARLDAQLAAARSGGTTFLGVPIGGTGAGGANVLLLAGLALVGFMIYKKR